MSKNVFANGREISAVKDGNTANSMPDVCHSPPPPPATPKIGVPIPYPNFSKSSATANGTKTVKIGGREAGLKNKSFYKTSSGNESATPALNKGVVSHKIKGKTHFTSWSFDVRYERKNVVRHMDMTTHNDKNVSPGMDKATQAPPPTESDCQKTHNKNEERRKELDSLSDETKANRKRKGRTVKNPDDKNPNAQGLDGCGVTVAAGAYTPPGGGISQVIPTQSNYSCLTVNLKEGVAEGNPAPNRANGSLLDCDGKGPRQYKGKPDATQAGGHCETRILDELKNLRLPLEKATLTLNIDWRKDGKKLKYPCESCHDMLCYAVNECKITVLLCKDENDENPVDMKDYCPYDYDKRNSLENLEKRDSLLNALGGT
ncbi:MAG: DUF4150 domain-containing protein [Peptococcaceae bacterium]|nr:DUF4150 domain-containing protein [Peptococcaceae bacterium]